MRVFTWEGLFTDEGSNFADNPLKTEFVASIGVLVSRRDSALIPVEVAGVVMLPLRFHKKKEKMQIGERKGRLHNRNLVDLDYKIKVEHRRVVHAVGFFLQAARP